MNIDQNVSNKAKFTLFVIKMSNMNGHFANMKCHKKKTDNKCQIILHFQFSQIGKFLNRMKNFEKTNYLPKKYIKV